VSEAADRQALMDAMVAAAVDAILCIDERGTVQWVNPSAELMFGYSAAEIVGRNVTLLMPAPYADEHDGYLARYFASGEPRVIGIGRDVVARHRDGTEIPVHLSVSEVRLEGRRLFTGFLHDLSPQRRLERELVAAQKLELIGRFAGSLAHDFNNLLMGIGACAHVAAGDARSDSRARKAFEEIGDAARRGVALTRRLLAFGRGEAVALHPTNLDDVLRANEAMLRQLLGEDVTLVVEHPRVDVHTRADEGLVEQILINLLINARDALPGGGRIHVALRPRGGEVALEVADSGVGIPAELHERIFEPFFTTKGPDKGTGLGLSTVRRIVGQLGGRIELESVPGAGTTFRVLLPDCAAPTAGARAPEAFAADASPVRSVLLVEDDRLVRASLRRYLEGEGHEVFAAGTPAAALAKTAAEDHLDVLVTDVVLPEISGGELAERLRRRFPSLEVIFMSANPQALLVEQGRIRSGERYLEKPFEPEDLGRLLAALAPRVV
jgi:PAS domain S-box-containing protein